MKFINPMIKHKTFGKIIRIIYKEYVIFHMIIILNDKKFDDKDYFG
jgi:hypothetical protein